MIIIKGDSGSGKSTAALKFIQEHKASSLYILLERDARISRMLHSEGFDYGLYRNGHLIDIKYRILERGGLMSNDLKYVVVDCLNLIKDSKSYEAKLAELENIEKDFGLEIVLIMNTLRIKNIKSQSAEFKQFGSIIETGKYKFFRPEEISSILLKGS